MALVVNNLPANARDLGSIPGSERSPGGGNSNPLQYSLIPRTEEPGRLQSMGSQRVRYDWAHTHAQALVAMHRLFIQALVMKHWLSCPVAGGILVLQPGIEPRSLALQSEFLTAGPPGKSLYRGFLIGIVSLAYRLNNILRCLSFTFSSNWLPSF